MNTLKNIFHHILFVIISSLFIFFVTFSSNILSGFCASIALDPSSVPTLGNVFNEGIFSLGPNPGTANIYTLPIWFTESFEPWLYNEFGYDLENFTYDSESGSVDMASVLAQAINRGTVSPEMVAQGYQIFSFASRAFGNQAKSYIMGIYDSATGTIKNVVDNAVSYIETGFFDNFRSLFGNSTASQSVVNVSDSGYDVDITDTINETWVSSSSGDTLSALINLSHNVYLFNSGSDKLYICWPVVSNLNDYMINGIFINSSGSHNITYLNMSTTQSFTINNIKYYYRGLYFQYEGATGNVSTSIDYTKQFYLNDLKAYLSAYVFDDSYAVERDYVDENGVAVDLGGILEGLEGHYVSQDDLAAIKSYIDSLVVDQDGNIVVTDEDEGVISGLIDDAIADSASIADELDTAIDDAIDIPINPAIPGGYFPSFIPDLLPEDMFSMFKPVLDIVGTSNSMYDIWIMIPVIFIAILVLYIVVSVL